MSHPSSRATSGSRGWWAIGLLLSPLLYALSLGPVLALSQRGWLPEQPVDLFYQPLYLLYDTRLATVLDWYERVWGVR